MNLFFNASNIKIKPISVELQSKKLVKKVLERLEKNEDSKDFKVEQTYIVFDKDNESWENVEQAIRLARKSKLGIMNLLKFGCWHILKMSKSIVH